MVPQWGRWHPLLLADSIKSMLNGNSKTKPHKGEKRVCSFLHRLSISLRTRPINSEIWENKRKINAFNKILRSSLQELKWHAKWTESPRWWRIESTFCPFVSEMSLITARQVSIAPRRSKEGENPSPLIKFNCYSWNLKQVAIRSRARKVKVRRGEK